jgi:hypothetical protein
VRALAVSRGQRDGNRSGYSVARAGSELGTAELDCAAVVLDSKDRRIRRSSPLLDMTPLDDRLCVGRGSGAGAESRSIRRRRAGVGDFCSECQSTQRSAGPGVAPGLRRPSPWYKAPQRRARRGVR